jgi:hypothetical protein
LKSDTNISLLKDQIRELSVKNTYLTKNGEYLILKNENLLSRNTKLKEIFDIENEEKLALKHQSMDLRETVTRLNVRVIVVF